MVAGTLALGALRFRFPLSVPRRPLRTLAFLAFLAVVPSDGTLIGFAHPVFRPGLLFGQPPVNNLLHEQSPDTLHDVGVIDILEPGPLVGGGKVVQPRAVVVNLGAATERYFDVRFRISNVYSEVLTISSIGPGSHFTLYFPPWTAVPGTYTASCSTALSIDQNPANDRVALNFAVLHPLRLYVERDQSAPIRPDDSADFLCRAELQGDTAAEVSLARSRAPAGWNVWLYDSSGRHEITGLGRLLPGLARHFRVRVRAPATFRLGALPPAAETVGITGFLTRDTTVADRVLLLLEPVPNDVAIHNFPNPLANHTTFEVSLPQEGTATLIIYNRAGEPVRRLLEGRTLSAGYHHIPWRADNDHRELVAPGTYQYVLSWSYKGRTTRTIRTLVVTRE